MLLVILLYYVILLRLSLPPEMGEMAQTFILEIAWLAVLTWIVLQQACRKSVSFLKFEPFIPTGSTNDFLLFI